MTSDGAAIAQALDDPELFAPHFRGPSWDAWRAFIAALFAASMTDGQLAIYQAHTGRTVAPTTAFTEAALVVGRRGGKSRVLALVAVALAVLRSYDEHLSAGEVATVGVLASTTKQGRSIFRYVSGLLKEIPSLRPMIVEESNDTILLSNRVQIEIAAASFRSTRGYTYVAVLCDEIAFWRSEESLNPDVEILRALRPGLASIPGSIMLLASSPYAKKGALYNSYRRHYGKDESRVLVWKAPTEAMNPRIDPAFIAEAYEEDPESARAEYGAEFRDDLADFITREAIDAITCWGRHELPPQAGVEYAGFVDPSGGASDSMTLAIGHQAGDLGILDALLEIRAPFDPDAAVAECVALLKRYNITRVVGDHYAGAWPVARFASHGITFEQSARGKSGIYGDFLPLANAGRVELLDHKRMAAQFVGLERRVGRSGKDSIAEPPGAHDDCCNSVAGVLVGLDLDRRPALIRRGDLLVADAPVEHHHPQAFNCVVWLSPTGQCATAFFSYEEAAAAKMVLVDFALEPWSGSILPMAAKRLDSLCDSALDRSRAVQQRGGAAAFMIVQDQLTAPGTSAMLTVFGAKLEAEYHATGRLRRVDVVPIAPAYTADPARLVLAAAGHVSMGQVKLSPLAVERAGGRPLLGSLALKPGEAVDADPLRVALLIGIAQLDAEWSPAVGATVSF